VPLEEGALVTLNEGIMLSTNVNRLSSKSPLRHQTGPWLYGAYRLNRGYSSVQMSL
jgi:hypothetical protein